MKEKILKFLHSTFSEADGSASASRVLAGATVVSTLGWVTYLVLLKHSLPDLGGASMFVTAGGSLYGVNKLSVAIKGSGDVKVTDQK
jgi:hypothetical protein